MNIANNLEFNLMIMLRSLGIGNFSCYIGGSYFFKKDKSDFSNGTSDIDVIIVLKKTKNNFNSLLNIFEKSILDFFYSGYLDILNFSYKYGSGRNSYNIKFMSIDLFHSILNLQELNFKSFRRDSLIRYKKETWFYSNDLEKPFLKITYQEEKLSCELGYILIYQLPPFKNGTFYLSDLLSMIVFSVNIVDGLNLNRKLEKSKGFAMVYDVKNENQIRNMFSYFVNKGIFSSEDINNIVFR